MSGSHIFAHGWTLCVIASMAWVLLGYPMVSLVVWLKLKDPWHARLIIGFAVVAAVIGTAIGSWASLHYGWIMYPENWAR